MNELLEIAFSPVNIAATSLLGVVLLYWLFLIIGAGSMDLFDFDIDFEAEIDSSMSVGMVTLDFLNIGRMPLMIWLSAFSVAWWTISVVWHDPANSESWFWGTQVVLRNIALAVIAAKVLTQPLRNRFDPQEPNRPEELLGKEVLVTSSNVTERFGQATLHTEAAPLILHVRSTDSSIVKGDHVTLIDYDLEKGHFLVAIHSREAV